jgi:hypothetical protein
MSTASEHGSSPIGQEADVGKFEKLLPEERQRETLKRQMARLAASRMYQFYDATRRAEAIIECEKLRKAIKDMGHEPEA